MTRLTDQQLTTAVTSAGRGVNRFPIHRSILVIVTLVVLAVGCTPGHDDSSASTPTTTGTPLAAPTTTPEDPTPTTGATGDQGDSAATRTARLDAIVEAWASRADIPGVIAQISGPDGPIWEGASGRTSLEDEGEALTIEHPFPIASITKPITAATVLRLSETGLVDLDASIEEYVPADIVDRVHVTDGVSRGDDVTVRQLLGHTSGIHDFFTDPAFVPDVLADPGREWSHDDLIDYAITHADPHFAPGGGFHYSETGYRLLGLIIEEVTGQPLHDAYRDVIFDPLDMDNTYLYGFEPARGITLSHPYLADVDGLTIHHTVDWAGGGLVSTASDLTTFIEALLGGHVFDQPGTLELMIDLQPTETGPNFEKLYGLGWLGLRSGDSELVGHDGFWGSFMYTVPDLGVTITGTVNQADANQLDLIVELLSALVPDGEDRS